MQADGAHGSQHAGRRLDMVDVVLDGPGGEAGDLVFFAHGDGGVAVPGDAPVVVG